MSKWTKIQKYLIKLCKNKYIMGGALIANFTLIIISTTLSIQQINVINEAYNVQILGAFFSSWEVNVCENILIQLLSPFLFKFRVHAFDQDLGLVGCPWRERNSILRLSYVTLSLILTIWQFIIVISNNGQHFWRFLYWSQWVIFVLMCTMFLLDIDGLYTGYNACINNFDVGGFGPIVLSLVGASFTTTLPPYFYSNPFFIPYQNEDSDTLIIEDFAITDGCLISPYIYTCLTDLGLFGVTYLVFTMSRFYDFGATKHAEDEMEDDGEPDMKQRNTKKHSMADYDENRKTHITSPAYPMHMNIYETELHGDGDNERNNKSEENRKDSLFEPAHWRPRKPTYEQNYS